DVADVRAQFLLVHHPYARSCRVLRQTLLHGGAEFWLMGLRTRALVAIRRAAQSATRFEVSRRTRARGDVHTLERHRARARRDQPPRQPGAGALLRRRMAEIRIRS